MLTLRWTFPTFSRQGKRTRDGTAARSIFILGERAIALFFSVAVLRPESIISVTIAITIIMPFRPSLVCRQILGQPLPLVLLLLLVLHGFAQKQELVQIVSSQFTQSLSPTATKMLPESLRFLQLLCAAELRAAQTNASTTITTISYVINKTTVVFRSTAFHARNLTSTIELFALATVDAIVLPNGTAFEGVRQRAAEDRRTDLNTLVETVCQGVQFASRIRDAVVESFNQTTSLGLSATAAAQLLAVNTIAIAPTQSNNSTPPMSDAVSTTSNEFAPVDIALTCVAVVIFLLSVFLVVQIRNDRIASSSAEPALRRVATTTTTTTTTSPPPAPTNFSKQRDQSNIATTGDLEENGTGRHAVRTVGEFKAGAREASSSMTSIIFTDFSGPVVSGSRPDKKPSRLFFVPEEVEHGETEPSSDSAVSVALWAVNQQSHQPEALMVTVSPKESAGPSYSSTGGDESSASSSSDLGRALMTVTRSGTSQSSAHSGWSTGSGSSSLLSSGSAGQEETKDALHGADVVEATAISPRSFSSSSFADMAQTHDATIAALYSASMADSPPVSVPGAIRSPFSELVQTLLSEPIGRGGENLQNASDQTEGGGSVGNEMSEPCNDQVFYSDASPTQSKVRHVFRNHSRSDSSGTSSSDDFFKAASKTSIAAQSQRSEPNAISDWMKSICVVSSASGTASVNTSLSSVTPPSPSVDLNSLGRSLDSPCSRRSEHRRRRLQSDAAADDNGVKVGSVEV